MPWVPIVAVHVEDAYLHLRGSLLGLPQPGLLLLRLGPLLLRRCLRTAGRTLDPGRHRAASRLELGSDPCKLLLSALVCGSRLVAQSAGLCCLLCGAG